MQLIYLTFCIDGSKAVYSGHTLSGSGMVLKGNEKELPSQTEHGLDSGNPGAGSRIVFGIEHW